MTMRLAVALLAALLPLFLAGAAAADQLEPTLEPAPPGLDALELARRAARALGSDGTYLEATLSTWSPRRSEPRVLRFRAWEDRVHRRAFLRVLEPPDRAGTGFLKLHPNAWKFAPRGQGASRIPPRRMLHRWMDSELAYDDLLHEWNEVEDYEHRLLGVAREPEGPGGLRAYVLEYLPREGVPVGWGRVVSWLEAEHGTPLRSEYYDASGEPMRALYFEEIREVQSRRVPHRWRAVRLTEKGRESLLEVGEIRFDQTFDDAIFTPRHLMETR